MARGRLTRIRLEEVPLEDRLAAAAQECATEYERAELRAAAFIPSQRVHYVPARAVADVLPARSDSPLPTLRVAV